MLEIFFALLQQLHLRADAMAGEQVGVAAALDEVSMFHDQDLVGAHLGVVAQRQRLNETVDVGGTRGATICV